MEKRTNLGGDGHTGRRGRDSDPADVAPGFGDRGRRHWGKSALCFLYLRTPHFFKYILYVRILERSISYVWFGLWRKHRGLR